MSPTPEPPSAAAFDTDVLIVGTGPTGATLALALAGLGVRCQLVSRWNWLADTPRAHIINQRAMEVFRDLGVEPAVGLHGTPWSQMGDTLFATSLAGAELLRIRTWGTGDDRHGDYLKGSPCPLMDIPQHLIEPVLINHAAQRGAGLRCNTEYLSHVQDAEGVTVELQDRLSERRYTLRARYLIGADGAKSQVMEDAGLKVEGTLARAGTVYIQFQADLSRYVQHRPSILYWIVTPSASFGEIGMGLLRAVRPWHQWIAGWGFDLSKGEPDLSDELVLSRIRTLIGDEQVDVQIERRSVWYVNQAHAPQYRNGRVLCGGDAVHRHPPSSGLGLNTCVQDAFNLAWKLAYVIQGHAGDALLDSYSEERAPVGRQVVQRANQSRLDYAPLKAALRVEGAANPVAAGIARFADPGPEGVTAREAVAEALALKNTEFNAQGIEMNQRCVSGAVIPDPQLEPETWARDPTLHLQASARPGAKLPHVWLVDHRGLRVSTLDVVGRGRFTLLTGLAGGAWAHAVEALARPYLHCRVIGAVSDGGLIDPYCDWQRVRGIAEAGALLVRPDGIIAWRHGAALHDPEAAQRLLQAALDQVLALAPDRPHP